MPKLLPRSFVPLCLLLLFAGGCRREPERVPVEGQVLVRGKAVPKGTNTFLPDATKGNNLGLEAKGDIGADGKFSLTSGGKPGAVPGWYKVAVLALETGDSSKPPVWLTPQKYGNFEQSPLRKEVVADAQAGAYTFDLEP